MSPSFSLIGLLLLAALAGAPPGRAQRPGPAKLAAAPALVAGPMLGYAEHREAAIWLEVSPTVRQVAVRYRPQTAAPAPVAPWRTAAYTGPLGRVFNPLTIALTDLQADTPYQYEVLLDGKAAPRPYPLAFRTKWVPEYTKTPRDFSFLFGSCLYLNDSTYDYPGKPYGQDPGILTTMARTPADFMLWGGDNVYLRVPDYSSAFGIRSRYRTNRAFPLLQPLLAARPNYAIWDDHDYGPNDANRSFGLRGVSADCFAHYWPHRSFGEPDNPGIYQHLKYGDADFFMMDDRSYRAPNELPDSLNGRPNPRKEFYGPRQLRWLEDGLIASRAAFKFVFTGGQMLNPRADKECFRYYPAEYEELLNFIVGNKIPGVVFLSGDRHFSEIIRLTPPGFYPLYDVTSSSITSGVHDISGTPEMQNPARVPGTLLLENNFVKVEIGGPPTDRTATFRALDRTGKERWQHVVRARELRVPGRP